MNEKDLINNLKKLRDIQPDSEYSSRSRLLILSSQKNFLNKEINLSRYGWFFGNFYLSQLAPSLGIIITIVAIGYLAISYMPNQQKRMVAKASEINADIQINLNKMQYYLDNNRAINPTNAETIIRLLEKSAEALNKAKDASADEKKAEEILEQVKNAQETLLKINELLK